MRFDDLPNDPEAAFIEVEKRCKEGLSNEIEKNEGNSNSILLQKYMREIHAAASVYNIQAISRIDVPLPRNFQIPDFTDFVAAVEHVVFQIQLRQARYKTNTVHLHTDTKDIIRGYIADIRVVLDQAEIEDAKKESLFDKLNIFQKELDRNRTSSQALGAFWIETCGYIGEGAKQLKPVKELLDSIGNVVGQAIHIEINNVLALPKSEQPKLIEHKPKSSEDAA